MSDKFLGTGGSNTSLTNGTAIIYASQLGANTLDPSRPVKTNSVRQLVSTNLDISEINSLSTQLLEKDELTFVEDDMHTNPSTGKVKIYAKTDGEMYKLNSQGVETSLGGGGGGVETVNAPVVDESMVFYSGTSGDQLKYVQNMKFISGLVHGDQLKIPDVQTDEHISLNTELRKIANISSSSQNPDITDFNGEIHVAKIKSASHNTELEFDSQGSAVLNAERDIAFYTNGFTYNGNIVLTDNTNMFIKRDGSLAMTGNLNMGNKSINSLTGLQGVTIPVVIFGPLGNPPKTVLNLDYDDVKLGTSLDLDNNTIKNVATPTQGTDGANKDYVDAQAGGHPGPVTGELEVKNFTPSSYPVDNKQGTGGIIVVGDDTTGVNKQGIIYYDNSFQTMNISSLNSPLILSGSSVSSGSDLYSDHFKIGSVGLTPGGMRYDFLGTNRSLLEGSFRAENLQADILKVESNRPTYVGLKSASEDVYVDNFMTFRWNAANYQLMFQPASIAGFYDVGVDMTKTGTGVSLKSFNGINCTPGILYYFSPNGTLDPAYNAGIYGNYLEYYLVYGNGSQPSYRIKIITGGVPIQVTVEKILP